LNKTDEGNKMTDECYQQNHTQEQEKKKPDPATRQIEIEYIK